ncbi:MAG: phage holin family protein [Nitrospiraceae bacterium]|nr:phage holin family protein [Nitrospiraceae bacterium]MSR23959.1 phage holin family protein [Nitrospiraceae bacterium]
MKGLFIRFVITGVAVLAAAEIVPGIKIDGVPAGAATVIILALLNAIVRPVLYLFSFPMIMFSIGLFMVIINAILLQFTSWLVTGFTVDGFWPSVWAALLISVVSTVLTLLISEEGKVEVLVHRPKPPRVLN